MKKYIYFLFCLLIISCQKEISSTPDLYLTPKENFEFKEKIVRFFEKLPKKVSHENKWNTENNEYYLKKVEEAEIMHYYKNDDGFIYFAIAKIAPSIYLKKVATIGKLKIENDSITYYEEICRTWKMEIPELSEKTKILFDKIVNDDDISQYYTKNSQPEFWIEFPDDLNSYDIENRKWIHKN